MPDVKWYSSSTASTGISVASGSGTTNRLMKFDASDNAADALLSDDGTNVTLTSGQLLVPNGTSGAPVLAESGSTGRGWYISASSVWTLVVSNTKTVSFDGSFGNVRLYPTGHYGWGTTDATSAIDTGLTRHAAASVRVTNGSTGTASIVLGTSSHPSTPASTYLFIEGVSGAGGTPTTSHLTAGSGVAVYTQQAHDAEATKFVIAYSLSGSMRYLSIPLDGATATWTHNATRP